MEITYILKNGKEVTRNYQLPVYENEAPDPDSLIFQYEEIDNTPEFILSRELPRQEMRVQNIVNCRIHYYVAEHQYAEIIEPDARAAMELWTEGMLPDFRAGNMGTSYQSRSVEPKPTTEAVAVETYSDVSVELELQRDGEGTEYYYYNIPDTATHTMELLMELGVPEASFFIPEEG